MTKASAIKVVHLITGLGVGGAETMLFKLLANSDRARFPARVISLTSEGALGARIRELGISVDCLGLKRGAPSPMAIPKLIEILRAERPRILQTWLYHADLLGLTVGRIARVPNVVWNIRCSDAETKAATWQMRTTTSLHALCSRFADAVIVNSQRGLDFHVARGHRPRRWDLIQNGFDLTRFHADPELRAERRRKLGLEPDDVAIGMTARYDVMKDHDTFISAAAELRRSHSNVRFVLAGTGITEENAHIRGLLEQTGLLPHTRLLGECGDVAKLLPAFDIATLCSISEGFPNAVGEAMSSELPCVASDVGDCALLLRDTGRVVPPRNAPALARAWHELIAMGPSERRRLGARARARIVEHFSLPSVVGRYEALYSELAEG